MNNTIQFIKPDGENIWFLMLSPLQKKEVCLNSESMILDNHAALEEFFASIEKRAFRIAEIAVGNREDALDIVQDSMLKLVNKYAGHNNDEWRALFYTILQSRIKDWYRRTMIRNRYRVWFTTGKDESGEGIVHEDVNQNAKTPEDNLQVSNCIHILGNTIRELPLRQQQAFMLRIFEEFDVKTTARVMNCSEGSVKTHYSRAVKKIREKLGEEWP